jgi:hypothetical protein
MVAIFAAAAIYVIYALSKLGGHFANTSEPELQRRALEAGRAAECAYHHFGPV